MKDCRITKQDNNRNNQSLKPANHTLNITREKMNSHLGLETIIEQNGLKAKTKALIDCGASQNFINAKLVKLLNLETQNKHRPLRIKVVDGRDINDGLITEKSI